MTGICTLCIFISMGNYEDIVWKPISEIDISDSKPAVEPLRLIGPISSNRLVLAVGTM